MTETVPSRPLTRADWEARPETMHREELLDGELVVMDAPRMIHQDMAAGLYDAVKAAAPPGIKVRFSPVAVHISDRIILEPDLVVGPTEIFEPRGLERPPLLAVEILSPTTRRRDQFRKFAWLQEFGCRHYWLADPDEPSVATWELVDGTYHEAGEAAGEETLRVERPFPVEIVPQRLLQD
jgi:Uma2 family endonuclease